VAPAIVGAGGLRGGWSGAWRNHSRRAYWGKRGGFYIVPLDRTVWQSSIGSYGLQSPQDGGSAPASGRERGRGTACDRCSGARGCRAPNRAWNERQTKRMPMLFSPTIGAAIAARYWFLWVRCPACRTINAIDLRTLDRHRDAGVTNLIPALSCRSCRPNAPFAELVRLSKTSIADEMREEHRRRVLPE